MLLVALLLTTALLSHPTTALYQNQPRRLYANPGQSVSILGHSDTPLKKCEFYFFPLNRLVDLSDGSDSLSSAVYEYYGGGLEKGDCGIRLKNVQGDNDGVVESKVQKTRNGEWERASTTLRVTSLDKSRLPVFEIFPKHADLVVGDDLTVTCNANRAITLCHFYLPGGTLLAFNEGPSSPSSPLARYHGNGLQHGHCGLRLTGVTTKLNGYIVCKVGDWPETVDGPWETEALHITTTGSRPPDTPARPLEELKCPPLEDPNLEFRCSTGIDVRAATVAVDCTKPMRPSTVVAMRCKSDIHLFDPFEDVPSIRCTDQGTWSGPLIKCELDCGNRNNVGRPFVSNANVSREGEFPWHIAIYKRVDRKYKLKCGGSLITPTLVVTAAHCFVDQRPNQQLNTRPYFIVAGKHRTNRFEGDEKTQSRNISQLIISRHFTGSLQHYAQDIAVIKVNFPYILSRSVNVVCIDWRGETSSYLREGAIGVVPGWGITETNEQPAELQYVELPYISHDTCWLKVPLDFQRYLTNDKMCGGYVDRGVSVCPGDSGGGYVFPVRATRGNRYYLKGIVSVGPKKEQDKCEINQIAAFTKVESHKKWLHGIVTKGVSIETL